MVPPSAKEVVERAYCLNVMIVFGKTVGASGTFPEDLTKLSSDKARTVEQTVEKISGKLLLAAEKFGFLNYLSIEEQRTLVTPYSSLKNHALTQATWRMESLHVLLWALSWIDEIPNYPDLAGDEILKLLPLDQFNQLCESAALRDQKEIESARELAELWHWRSRTRQLIEEKRPFPEMPQFKSYDEIVRLTAKAALENKQFEVCNEDFAVKNKAYRDLTEQEWFQVRSITVERHFALNWLCGYAPSNRWDETPTET